MPAQCSVCQSEDFTKDNEDMLFCRLCGTISQEQDHFQVTVSQFTDVQPSFVAVHRDVHTEIEKVLEADEINLGRPWRTEEGFQHIMMEQVAALIELGASKNLRDIVFSLWTFYLRKCGKIGTKNGEGMNGERILRKDRIRDKYPGTIADPRIYTAKAVMKIDDAPETYIRKKAQSVLLQRERERQSCRKKESKVEKMSMVKTLCFVYLGLHLTNSKTLIFDLLRWVRQGVVPYRRLTNWPSDMKFYSNDADVFSPTRIPTSEEFFIEISKLINYMELDCFKSFDIRRISSRLIMELGLPYELNSIVSNFISNAPLNIKLAPSRLFGIEPASMAISYVVYVLKLIFGLDDNTEKLLSNYADWLKERIEFEKPMFVWRDWFLYAEHKHRELQGVSNFKDMNDMSYMSNVKNVVDPPRDLFSMKPRSHGRRHNNRIDHHKDFHDLLLQFDKSLQVVNEPQHHSDDDDDDDDGEFNLLTNVDRKTPAKKIDKSPFINTTLVYLLENNFLDKLSKTQNNFGGNDPEDLNCSVTDIFLSQDNNDDVCHDSHQSQIKCYPTTPGTTLKQIVQNIPKVYRSGIRPCQTYLLYPVKVTKDKRIVDKYDLSRCNKKDGEAKRDVKSNSYRWLLEICSKHVNVSLKYLEVNLRKLEIILLDDITKKRLEKLYGQVHFSARIFRGTGRRGPSGGSRVSSQSLGGAVNQENHRKRKRNEDSDDDDDETEA